MSGNVTAVFLAIADLVIALGDAPLDKHPGVYELQVDECWKFAINGHQQVHLWNDVAVQPFQCVVEFNGWPAGYFSPNGGVIAAGTLANEQTFLAAIRARWAKTPPPEGFIHCATCFERRPLKGASYDPIVETWACDRCAGQYLNCRRVH